MTKVNNWDSLPVNLDIRYVCIVLGVSEPTVKRWLYNGTLKGAKIGRKWFFPKEYIKSLTEPKTVNYAKKESKTKKKHRYGEYKNVYLTDDELAKLKSTFPNDWEKRIEDMSKGIEMKGYKYKNHYLAILKWAKNEKAPGSNERQSGKQENYSVSFDLEAFESKLNRD